MHLAAGLMTELMAVWQGSTQYFKRLGIWTLMLIRLPDVPEEAVTQHLNCKQPG